MIEFRANRFNPSGLRRLIFALPLMIGLLFTMLPFSALAVNPDEMLADPVLEARAREISAQIRCTQCQNQTIDDSDASIARDMRLVVRERLLAGDSNDEVLNYLFQRYGDFVLMKPRFGGAALYLWLLPIVFLAFGVFLVWGTMAGRKIGEDGNNGRAKKLSKAELRAIEKLLEGEKLIDDE